MSHPVTFPFTPPWEDLQQTVNTQHGPCYFFNTDSKGLSREEKRRADGAMVKAYQESRRMERLAKTGAGEAEPAGEPGDSAKTRQGEHRS